MELSAHISYRQIYSERKVLLMRVIRYIQTGYLLHMMGLFSILMVYFFGKGFLIQLKSGEAVWKLILFGYASLYFFSLVFFSQFDARSRYQNYKMIKDKFYEYGFDARLLKPFIYSRCQRDAIAVAAREFDFGMELRRLTFASGFRWYHVLPTLILKRPRVLFTKEYWSKTLFVKTYLSKYFLW
ncbi:MAG: hypothetical protein P8100_14860 [bacterium]